MQESKLIEILKTFSPGELKSFKKFIISPFITVRNVDGLFSEIKRYYPDFTSEKLSKSEVFKKLFPGELYNEKKLKNLIVDLTRLAEHFLVYRAVGNNPFEFERILAGEFRNRKSDKLFSRSLKILESKSAGTQFGSIECFNEEEKTERLKESYYISRNRFDISVQSKLKYSEHFTASFLIRFMRKLRDKRSVIKGYNLPFESPLLESVLESIDFDKMLEGMKKKKYSYLWLIEIYYYVYKSAYEENDEVFYYNKLKKAFLENIKKFSHTEKFFLFNDLVDCCITKETRGYRQFEAEELEIYKQMFGCNIYSSNENDYLSIVLYRNILLLGLTLREFEWLNTFIGAFTQKLRPEYRSSMMNLAYANLSFEQGEYEKALSYVRSIEYDFFLYKTDIRTLSLKIYYELDLYETAFSLVDSFRHFLAGSDEISVLHKRRHTNFINFYNRLLKAKSTGGSAEAAENISFEIEKHRETAGKSWLLEKCGELSAVK